MIPRFDVLMLPLLKLTAERTWRVADLVPHMADHLGLSAEERARQVSSSRGTVINSRVNWAKTYLKQAALVEQPSRGLVRITERGRHVLAANPVKIDVPYLERYDEFKDFRARTGVSSKKILDDPPATASSFELSLTPEEQIAAAAAVMETNTRDLLLARILESSPAFFEKLIIKLLLAMGYGGSEQNAGEHVGGTGDGGIDGVIREDHLGLGQIYLQAKRYKLGNTVSAEAVQAFVGALVGRGAHRGVFITTSIFSTAAIKVADQAGSLRVILINGDELTRLMLRFNVGVRVRQIVEMKDVDPTYFKDEDDD